VPTASATSSCPIDRRERVIGLAARRFAGGPVRFIGPLGLALNTAVIVALVMIDYTRDAAPFSSTG
jgi:hypothetical protein